MKSPSLRSAFSGAIVGSVAVSVGAQLLVTVSGIVAARTLGPSGRGELALLWLIPLVANLLGGLGMPVATTFYVARDPVNARSIVRRVTPLLCLQIAVTTAIQALITVVVVLPRYPTIGSAAAISLLTTSAVFTHNYAVAVLQGLRRFRSFNILRVTPSALYTCGILVLVLLKVATVTSIVAALCASFAIGALAGWAIILITVPRPQERTDVSRRAMLRFGLRGLLGSSSPVDDLQLDQLIVGFFLTAYDLGFYVAALAVTNLPRFLAQSVGLVAYPTVASAYPERRYRTGKQYVLIGLALVVPVVLVLEGTVTWLIPFLYGDAFSPSIQTARILLFGSVFFAARRLLVEVSRGLGKPAVGSIGELVSLMVLVPTVIIMASIGGTEGVAWATALSGAASVVVILLLLRRGARSHMPGS